MKNEQLEISLSSSPSEARLRVEDQLPLFQRGRVSPFGKGGMKRGIFLLVMIMISGNAFAQSTMLTPVQFENQLSTFFCQPYKLSKETTELRKSDVVQEVVKILETKNISFPADWKTILFTDLEGDEPYFQSAQILASLRVIPFEEFGNQDAVNPLVTKSQAQEVLNNIFDQSKCDFALNLDWDRDGIYNYNDRCPRVPARNTENGCPLFSFRPYSKIQKPRIVIKSRLNDARSPDLGYYFYEQTQIKKGDKIRAVILNPKTKEVLSGSEWMEVKN